MSLESTYRNPFSDYNANFLDNKQLTDFWETPFNNEICNISEEEFMTEKMPIIFTGGRGTGKTMLLRHFELMSEIVRAEKQNNDLKEYIMDRKFLGIYVRFDSPLLHSFTGLDVDINKWNVIFSHFYEMTLCKAFIDVIKKLFDNKIISEKETTSIVKGVIDYTKIKLDSYDMSSLSNALKSRINYVNRYRSNLAIDAIEFEPDVIFQSSSSQNLVDVIKSECNVLENMNFLVLLDEYENFLEYEQKIVNSSIKFNTKYAMRIGMRPMGFHTFDTVSENEYIKENRDYRNIVLGNPIISTRNIDVYKKFLLSIAAKRLKSVPLFRDEGLLKLEDFLGKHEDPVNESIKIVKGRDIHINQYIREIVELYKSKKEEFIIDDEKMKKLRYPNNPLYEMQNMRMLLKPYPIDYVIKAFTDYINMVKSEEAKKYKNDYENKYKLAYVFVLRSIYRNKSKQYYGVSDFAMLSSGITGVFIELCRSAFQHAFFLAKDDLFKGKISPEIQTRAAREVGKSELEQIKRISQVGNFVSTFSNNLGNIFSEYHTDKRIRYPETNQFSICCNNFEPKSVEEKTFKALVEWSVIQKKEDLQQLSIGKNDGDVFILNHIFAPNFNISTRTRGGFNVEMNAEEFKDFISTSIDATKYMKSKHGKVKEKSKDVQLELFNINTKEEING